jgi:hypothetical protein
VSRFPFTFAKACSHTDDAWLAATSQHLSAAASEMMTLGERSDGQNDGMTTSQCHLRIYNDGETSDRPNLICSRSRPKLDCMVRGRDDAKKILETFDSLPARKVSLLQDQPPCRMTCILSNEARSRQTRGQQEVRDNAMVCCPRQCFHGTALMQGGRA